MKIMVLVEEKLERLMIRDITLPKLKFGHAFLDIFGILIGFPKGPDAKGRRFSLRRMTLDGFTQIDNFFKRNVFKSLERKIDHANLINKC